MGLLRFASEAGQPLVARSVEYVKLTMQKTLLAKEQELSDQFGKPEQVDLPSTINARTHQIFTTARNDSTTK